MNLSIVIPVYNEEESLPILHEAIQKALSAIEAAWEVIYVDDGSQDGSLEALQSLVSSDPTHVGVVALRRNFGQTADRKSTRLNSSHTDIPRMPSSARKKKQPPSPPLT